VSNPEVRVTSNHLKNFCLPEGELGVAEEAKHKFTPQLMDESEKTDQAFSSKA